MGDILFSERLVAGFSALTSWRRYAANCGWDIPDRKSRPPSQKFRTLGDQTELSAFPRGSILLRPVADRVMHMLDDLREILRNGSLTPAFVGKLFVRMVFTSSQYSMKDGRCMLRAFSRQHKQRCGWNPQLEASCKLWVRNLASGKPRAVPAHLGKLPVAISYSDGEAQVELVLLYGHLAGVPLRAA